MSDHHFVSAPEAPLSSCETSAAVLQSSGLGATFTPISIAQARAWAHTHYGITGEFTRLATEKDDTFRIRTADGAAYVLKIANPAESQDDIAMQLALLVHIANTAPQLPVPRVVADRRGGTLVTCEDDARQLRRMRMMTFLDGQVLDSTTSNAEERAQLGRMLARLRLAMADFSHPGGQRLLAWDVQHVQALRPLLAHVGQPHHRRQLDTALQRLHTQLTPRLPALRRQILHNDFSQSNIVVQHGHPDFVTGIIDFGDAVRTAIAIDVSTALLNQLPRDASAQSAPDLFAQGRDVLRGYLAVADLLPEERALLPYLVMARIVARALLTTWRAKLMPDNAPYILRNTPPGWAQLDWLLARDDATLSAWLVSESCP